MWFPEAFYADVYGIKKSKFYINITEAFAMHSSNSVG